MVDSISSQEVLHDPIHISSLFVMQWTTFFSVSTLIWYLCMPLFCYMVSYWIIRIVLKHQILY